jgi:putative ABC transport system permease protein
VIDRETWRLALTALRASKLKALLTTLGVVIGAGSIVLVVTVALTGKRYIIAQIEGIGANLVYAEHVRAGDEQHATLGDEITPADLEAIHASIPEVVEVAGTRDLPATVVVQGIERPVRLVGVTEGFQRIRNLAVLTGRFLDADDLATHAKVCLLTKELSDRIFGDTNPLDRVVRVGELRFTVIGVFEERVATFGQSEIMPESVIIGFPLMSYYAGNEFVKVLYAQANGPDSVASVTQQVDALLRARHRAAATYRVENLTSLLQAAQRISLALTIVLVIVACVALAISGIGIMNIMLVTVTERTSEIGLRKAVGAPRHTILGQFLLEAALMSGGGGIVGIVAAVALCLAVRAFLPGPLTIPISGVSILLAFAVSCGTGVICGYLPASRAANLPPTEALRHE